MSRLSSAHSASLTVALGSTSPAKRRAVEEALREVRSSGASSFVEAVRVVTMAATSGVPDQPWGDDDTRRGATQRAQQALEATPDATLAFGIEGGVQDDPAGSLWAFAWVVALAADGTAGVARSAAFIVPDQLAAAVRGGEELGDALDNTYGLRRAKDGAGAVGVLTGGLIDRAELYRPAVLLALIPWLSPCGHGDER